MDRYTCLITRVYKILYYALASDSIDKGKMLNIYRQKAYYLGSKLNAAHQVNYFRGFLGKNIENCPPSKLLLFTSLCSYNTCFIRFSLSFSSEYTLDRV